MRLLFLLLTPFLACASDVSADNANLFGVWTLIPPFVSIVLAFITKDVIFSLFVGVLSGTFMISVANNSFLSSIILAFTDFISRILKSMSTPWNAGILLQVLCIGGLVALVTKMGGAKALAMWFLKRSKSPVSAQISTWLMGLFVFFDDYANALIVGPIMKPVTDKFRISRAKLAFIIDSTAAPVAGIALISTWIGLEISLIKDAYSSIGMNNINAFGIFLQTIPYRFYNIFMLFFVAATAIMSREFGPMYKAQMDCKNSTKEIKDENENDLGEEGRAIRPKDDIVYRKINAIVPVFILIGGAFIGFYFNGLSALEGDILKEVKASPLSFMAFRETFGAADASVVIFQAGLFASIVAIVMGVWQKIYSMKEALEVWVAGWKTMVITVVILLLAWSLSSVIKDLGTSKYLVKLLSDKTPYYLLPILIFVLGSFISFSTGTSYGTMGILMPLAVPLAFAVGQNAGFSGSELDNYLFVSVSGVLTGAIFGDHCSPISDTTILSSMGAGCNHIEHVSTQIVYALVIGIISAVFGYLFVAFGMNVWLSILLGMVAIVVMLRIFGKKV